MPTVVKLIEPIVDLSKPGQSQQRWERGNRRSNNYEQLCITLAGKAVTIAIEHVHPGTQNTLLRATMQINSNRHELYLRSVSEARIGGAALGSRAVAMFLPTLQHSLRELGLR